MGGEGWSCRGVTSEPSCIAAVGMPQLLGAESPDQESLGTYIGSEADFQYCY